MTSGKIIANTLRQMNIRANALVWAKVRGQGKWILFSIRKFSGNGEINHKLYDGSPDENFQKFSFENFHDDSAYTDRNGNSLLEVKILIMSTKKYKYCIFDPFFKVLHKYLIFWRELKVFFFRFCDWWTLTEKCQTTTLSITWDEIKL